MSQPSTSLSSTSRAALEARIAAAHKAARRASASGAMQYLNQVIIDKPGDPTPFRAVAENWQWLLASRIIPAIDSLAGVRQGYTGPRSFWFTLPRGHDKTSLIGRLCSWLLAFSRTPLRCVAAAADREQAGFISEFMTTESRLNPWLDEMLKFSSWRVEGPQGSRLKILAAEDKSSFGLKEDLMILDEVTHWPKRGLWDTIISGREKRPGSVVVVITNAGLYGTWQRDVFETVRESPDWYVYEAPGQLAGWMDPRKIADVRRSLPAALCRRLFDNQWIDPSEESGFVSRTEAGLCVDANLFALEKGNPKHSYVASIDYAPVKDRTVMCVGHEENGEVQLDRMDILQGSPTDRVRIEVVERWIDDVSKNFFKPTLVVDPYQMESTIQRYEGTLEVVRFEARGGKANYELASNLRNLIINRRLRLYPGAGQLIVEGRFQDLVDELATVLLRVMSYGYRIDTRNGQHDDRVIALGQMALELVRRSGRITVPTGKRWF